MLKKFKTLQVSLIQSAHGECSSYQEHTCPWDVPLLLLPVQQQDGVSDNCSHTERCSSETVSLMDFLTGEWPQVASGLY